jgi:hypothetical protein
MGTLTTGVFLVGYAVGLVAGKVAIGVQRCRSPCNSYNCRRSSWSSTCGGTCHCHLGHGERASERIAHPCTGHLRAPLANEVVWSHLRVTISSSGWSLANFAILAMKMPHCIDE